MQPRLAVKQGKLQTDCSMELWQLRPQASFALSSNICAGQVKGSPRFLRSGSGALMRVSRPPLAPSRPALPMVCYAGIPMPF